MTRTLSSSIGDLLAALRGRRFRDRIMAAMLAYASCNRITTAERRRANGMRAAAVVVLVVTLWAPLARAAPLVSAVQGVAITVTDADRSAAFFSNLLGFERTDDTEASGPEYERLEGVAGLRVHVVHMTLGSERIDLLEYLTPRGRPVPADSRSNDRWFQHVAIVVGDMDAAYRKLRDHHIEQVSSGPQTLPAWNPKAGGIKAFYFKDPDGHVLELIQFPPGKGEARWQQSNGKLFLGIDHTAIVVADTDASLRFYRDTLGMRVAGESKNWGAEQEHLTGVPGAHLRITSLRASSGPGVELLEYVAPRNGRPYPADLRANDVAFWRTVLEAPDLRHAEAAIRGDDVAHVTSGTVPLMDDSLGFAAGFAVRDPDGHTVELVSEP